MAAQSSKNDATVDFLRNPSRYNFHGGQQHSFLFTIEHLNRLPMDVGEYFESPLLKRDGKDKTTFFLRLFPGGDSEWSKDYVSLHIVANPTTDDPINISCTVGIMVKGRELEGFTDIVEDVKNNRVVVPKFMNRDVLWKGKNQFMPKGVLTIVAKIRTFDRKEVVRQHIARGVPDSGPSPSDDMPELFTSEGLSDLTIYANGTAFQVHKCILAERWPYFEGNRNPGRFSDAIHFQVDPAIMKQVLLYLYTNQKPELDEESAPAMLAFAVEYDLYNLKQLCLEHILLNLSRSNVVSVLLLAEKHDLRYLRKKCIQFVCDDEDYLSQLGLWKPALMGHPRVLRDILTTAMNNGYEVDIEKELAEAMGKAENETDNEKSDN